MLKLWDRNVLTVQGNIFFLVRVKIGLPKNLHNIRLFQNSHVWVPISKYSLEVKSTATKPLWCDVIKLWAQFPSTTCNPEVLVKQQLGLQSFSSVRLKDYSYSFLQSSFEQFKNNMLCLLYQIHQSGTEVKTLYVQPIRAKEHWQPRPLEVTPVVREVIKNERCRATSFTNSCCEVLYFHVVLKTQL